MLYPNIVLDSILNIFFLKDLFSLFLILLMFFLFYVLWNKFAQEKKIYRILIIGMRFLILILIIPLIQNKIFKKTESFSKKQNIGVVIDNSMSMDKIINSNNLLDIDTIIKEFKNWGTSNDLNLFWYNLDSSLKNKEIIFNRKNTSFDYLDKILINNDLDQLFLVSDGNINNGILSDKIYNSNKVKIHTIGLGELEDLKQNIKINDVKIELLNDSISIKSKCWVNIKEKNSKILFNIFSDSINTKIYSDTIILNSGIYNFDKNIKIHSSKINNNLLLDLEPLNFSDETMYDNKWSFDIIKNKSKNILFLTGKLTYNTSFLKKILLKTSKSFNIDKWVAINNIDKLEINKKLNKYDYIIFDNFPNTDIHIDLLNKIYDLNIPVIFFEGYDFNAKYLMKMLNLYYPNQFYIEKKENINKVFNLGNQKGVGVVYSNYNLFSNDNISMSMNLFSNKSISEINNSKLSVFLIPNISEVNFFMNTNHNNNYIEKYIEYIINNNLNNKEIINFKLKKNNYFLGEKLLFELNNKKIPFDILESKLIIKDIVQNKIDSINYNSEMSIRFDNSGEFQVYFLFKGTNNEIINSNIENFNVIEENIELDNIAQNIKLLHDFSSKTKGKYINAYDFNIDYFNSINNNEIISTYNKIYNALDLFIKEKIYLLVIALFVLEIFFRKRIGLL